MLHQAVETSLLLKVYLFSFVCLTVSECPGSDPIYMTDQGLPRCWGVGLNEAGQTRQLNTHFLCVSGAFQGMRERSLTRLFFFVFFFVKLFAQCMTGIADSFAK